MKMEQWLMAHELSDILNLSSTISCTENGKVWTLLFLLLLTYVMGNMWVIQLKTDWVNLENFHYVEAHDLKIWLRGPIVTCENIYFIGRFSQHATLIVQSSIKIKDFSWSTMCPKNRLKFDFGNVSASSWLNWQCKVSFKSKCSENSKTLLTFDIWPSTSQDNWGKNHHGSFSVLHFTFLCMILSCLAVMIILQYYLWYFQHNWASF